MNYHSLLAVLPTSDLAHFTQYLALFGLINLQNYALPLDCCIPHLGPPLPPLHHHWKHLPIQANI